MNIALSAVLLIMLCLPGSTAILAYYRSFTEKKSSIHIGFNELIFRSLFVSLIIHCIALCILSLPFLDGEPQVLFVYDVLIGKDIEKEIGFTNTTFLSYFRQFCLYTLILVMISFIVVKYVKRFIQKHNMDLDYNALRNQNYWFHIFSARYLESQGISGNQSDTDFIFLDIMTEKGIMYSGILLDFNYSSYTDKLENIILRNAMKRACLDIDYDKHIKRHELSFPTDIPGDALVIEASKILNINIYYFQVV